MLPLLSGYFLAALSSTMVNALRPHSSAQIPQPLQ
jgi:hypothetical protein